MATMREDQRKADEAAAAIAAKKEAANASFEASRAEKEAYAASPRGRAEELGFFAGDDETAQKFLDLGRRGTRRSEFLGQLYAQGAVNFTPKARDLAPGQPAFIAPEAERPKPSVSPKQAKRQERLAASRLAKSAAKIGNNLARLGVNLDKVTEPAKGPKVANPDATTQEDVDIKSGESVTPENSGGSTKVMDAFDKNAEDKATKKFTEEGAIKLAKDNLAGIQAANSEFDAANTVGTNIKVTKRTRK
jgi:hypothetical protein